MATFTSLLASVALIVLVAMLLKGLIGAPPLPEETSLDQLSRELLGEAEAAVDLTRPRVRDVSCVVFRLCDYATLTQVRELEEIYPVVDLFYRTVATAAEARKGEVTAPSGNEIFVVFGRILSVDDPLQSALGLAADVHESFPRDLARLDLSSPVPAGVAAAVTRGPTLSGPLGNPSHRTYGSVGRAPLRAFQLARVAPAGSIAIPLELEAQVSPFYDIIEGLDPVHRGRLLGARRERRQAVPMSQVLLNIEAADCDDDPGEDPREDDPRGETPGAGPEGDPVRAGSGTDTGTGSGSDPLPSPAPDAPAHQDVDKGSGEVLTFGHEPP